MGLFHRSKKTKETKETTKTAKTTKHSVKKKSFFGNLFSKGKSHSSKSKSKNKVFKNGLRIRRSLDDNGYILYNSNIYPR